MTQASPAAARAPWHLWAIGVVAALWNGFACYDYTMTKIGGEAYLRANGLPEAIIAQYVASPVWYTAAWAIGVWGGLLGGLLLLLRRKWALYAFVASFAAFLLMVLYEYVLTSGGQLAGASGAVMTALIAAFCVFFIWYAWTAGKRGWLR